MKSVTPLFTNTLNRKAIRVQRQVYYKRRYWVAISSNFAWESSWTLLSETQIVSVSPITAQLDTTNQNEFKISNVTLLVNNLKKQWRKDNVYGYFAVDAGSSNGYEPYLMKFQFKNGLVYDDGTTEMLTMFTGVVTDINYSSSAGTAQINISGLQQLLVKANAEAVSTTVTSEVVGTGNGSTTVFSTANKGVGIIKSVAVAGTVKTAGVDYTISKTNDAANFATITFIVAPASGSITATYVYWKQSQKFETLITGLLNQAGIPAGNQQVSPVVFPTNITVTHIWQLLSDWTGAGTSLTNLDSTSITNNLEYYYDDSQTWPNSLSGWTQDFSGSASLASTGSGIQATPGSTIGTAAGVYRAMTNTFSTWQISFTDSGKQNNDNIYWGLFGASYTGMSSPYNFGSGYVIYVRMSAGQYTVNVVKTDSTGTNIDFASPTVFPTRVSSTSTHTIKVIRRSLSTFYVYFDGTLVNTYTDAGTPWNTAAYTGVIFSWQGALGTDQFTLNTASYLVPHCTSNQGTWISGTIDLGATPSSWSSLAYTQTLNGGTITYYTRTSPDGSTWDAYVAVSGTVIGSTLRRYVQVKAVLDITSGDPVLTNITLTALTSSTVITLANFTGMTCYDAITQIAALANYEFGFDGSENFFFRQKKLTSTPAMTLTQNDFLSEILALTGGYEVVYSSVRSTYGGYFSQVDDAAGTITAPTQRFGYALYQPGGSTFLVLADANLAANIAQSAFNYYNLPRKKLKVRTKFLPQVDLSDVVQVSFIDNPPPAGWYWGDTAVYWGMPNIYYYGGADHSTGDIENMIGKVVGFRVDTDNWECEMDLEEVI